MWAQGESTAGRASMLANMRYHTNVIISLFSALGSLAASSRKLMKTGAYALRIRQLEDIAAEIAAGAFSAHFLMTILRSRDQEAHRPASPSW